MTPLVSIRNLGVALGGTTILRSFDAGLARGKITALIGLNGSGKTTCLRASCAKSLLLGKSPFIAATTIANQIPAMWATYRKSSGSTPTCR